MREILTPLGARVQVVPAPEHLGPGVLLVLTMIDLADNRRAEVFLSPANQIDLASALTSEGNE